MKKMMTVILTAGCIFAANAADVEVNLPGFFLRIFDREDHGRPERIVEPRAPEPVPHRFAEVPPPEPKKDRPPECGERVHRKVEHHKHKGRMI